MALVYLAALWRSRPLLIFSALLFTSAILFSAARFNIPLWRNPVREQRIAPADALHRTSLYSALVYGWGAAAMFLSYPIAALPWQHGWQYGLAMAVVSVSIFYYLERLAAGDELVSGPLGLDRAVQLAALQGIAMTGVLVLLALSGKLTAKIVDWKADWAANILFAAGAFCLAVLSVFIVKTHAALKAPT